MEKSVDALTEHEVFIRDLISLYKQKPALWQQKHPDYRNKLERAAAYTALVRKSQEYYPAADEDFVRMKFESMRASFRKERKKVLLSKQNSSNPEEIHKPSLWYYDLLLFIAGEDVENEANVNDVKCEKGSVRNNPNDGNSVKIPFWSREHSAILINFYKNHPSLYSTSHPCYRNKRRRNEAIKKITDKLQATTGKFFHARDVRRKISLIRGQFLYEYKKIKNCENRGVVYKPTLWCFELLSFLKGEYISPKKANMKRIERHMSLRPKALRKTSSSEESEDDVDIKKESDASMSSESVHLEPLEPNESFNDDIFDTIAKNLAHQMRSMTEKQRYVANKIVRDVMYHGQMEHLTDNSKLSIDGT